MRELVWPDDFAWLDLQRVPAPSEAVTETECALPDRAECRAALTSDSGPLGGDKWIRRKGKSVSVGGSGVWEDGRAGLTLNASRPCRRWPAVASALPKTGR